MVHEAVRCVQLLPVPISTLGGWHPIVEIKDLDIVGISEETRADIGFLRKEEGEKF